ncbi:MAG: hypothetical protein KAS88_00365 [Deltaproteobacteria bacterium]|nr:hypothetical protein [Deltaproteobacteria bacterium]
MSKGYEGDRAFTGDGQTVDSSRVAFTPEQQVKVQELIDESYKRAYQKARKGTVSSADVELMQHEIGGLREERKRAAILGSVSRHNVVDSMEVAELIRGSVVEGDGGALGVMVNSKDAESGGVMMGVDEYVDSWLSDRPHHMRSPGMVGAGSSAAFFGGGGRKAYNLSDPNLWRTLPREEVDRVLSEGINVQGVSGQTFSFKDVKNPFLEAKKRSNKTGG